MIAGGRSMIDLRWLHMLVMAALLSAGIAAALHTPAMAAPAAAVVVLPAAPDACGPSCTDADAGRILGHQGCNTFDCASPAILGMEPLSMARAGAAGAAEPIRALRSEEHALETPPPIA